MFVHLFSFLDFAARFQKRLPVIDLFWHPETRHRYGYIPLNKLRIKNNTVIIFSTNINLFFTMASMIKNRYPTFQPLFGGTCFYIVPSKIKQQYSDMYIGLPGHFPVSHLHGRHYIYIFFFFSHLFHLFLYTLLCFKSLSLDNFPFGIFDMFH